MLLPNVVFTILAAIHPKQLSLNLTLESIETEYLNGGCCGSNCSSLLMPLFSQSIIDSDDFSANISDLMWPIGVWNNHSQTLSLECSSLNGAQNVTFLSQQHHVRKPVVYNCSAVAKSCSCDMRGPFLIKGHVPDSFNNSVANLMPENISYKTGVQRSENEISRFQTEQVSSVNTGPLLARVIPVLNCDLLNDICLDIKFTRVTKTETGEITKVELCTGRLCSHSCKSNGFRGTASEVLAGRNGGCNCAHDIKDSRCSEAGGLIEPTEEDEFG